MVIYDLSFVNAASRFGCPADSLIYVTSSSVPFRMLNLALGFRKQRSRLIFNIIVPVLFF
jgi:hypothetical protein